jgi:predicted nucleic acid-binding protein
MKIFVDTNVFVYALNVASPFRRVALDVLRQVDAGELQAHCSYQVLAELYAVITGRRVERPLSPAEAAVEIRRLVASESIVKLGVDDRVAQHAITLASQYELRGVDIFDAQIVATMLRHDVPCVYTANERDFARFETIRVINPFAPVSRAEEPHPRYRATPTRAAPIPRPRSPRRRGRSPLRPA